ncbi:hypothetical protein [Limnoglobus roseus]|uniref:Uncharacterized protein n=1 Tax=Limnoglobus roseus TaxID=2598579 RepID=A0A5C1A3U3_9BACT|nr:hypothetical protein [Limnoglobus roseus]QEL13761.1 hypothetical protein PX52LOC_00619 [Limnoglobus roseus]
MSLSHRRTFLEDVGRGMLLAGVGPALAADLGLATARADEEPKALHFGELEPLAALLQETPAGKLLPLLASKQKAGLSLRELTAAAALANARTFGGEDYFGFHVFMALAPAYHMAQELPKAEQALPIWKVLYRNAHYTEKAGGRTKEVLKPLPPSEATEKPTAESVRAAVDRGNAVKAEQALAALGRQSPDDMLNAAILGVEDNHDVHTAVLPWRAWAMLDLVGRDHALTLLRQSVHQCAKRCAENRRKPQEIAEARAVLPKLLDQHKLMGGPKGTRAGDDTWVEKLAATIYTSKPEQAGGAVAAALAEGFSPEQVGEAVSMASNQLVLRQVEKWDGNYGRRTHGDSPGVHASDATNAWRNVARVGSPRNRAAGLILAAMNVADSSTWAGSRTPPGMEAEAYPHAEQLAAIKSKEPADLLKELDGAIRENDQLRACAVVHAYGAGGHESRPMFDALLRYAISEDGRLHAEKFYRTVSEEFATTRPAFRWRQLVALARVSASAYGFSQSDRKEGRAPGYEESRRLLGV